MTNKMTVKNSIQYVLDNCEIPADVREKLTSHVEALSRKSTSGTRKPTARQTENATLRAEIVDFLANATEGYTCTELAKAIPSLEGMNNQRISALLVPLVKDKVVIKETVKGKSVFSSAPDAE